MISYHLEANHSPAPWKPDDNHGCRSIRSVAKDSVEKEIAYTSGLPNDHEDLANATLISYAPELFAEVRKLKGMLRDLAASVKAGLTREDNACWPTIEPWTKRERDQVLINAADRALEYINTVKDEASES